MSNDLKYVLLPTLEDQRRTPKFQPWPVHEKHSLVKYRERFRMKYPCNINTKNWKFVKDGLDDFRDGLPPAHDDIILEPEKGPGPVLISENRRIKATVSNVQNRLNEHQRHFSREIPAAEKRRLTIDSYISTLLEHPMAFFSHFSQTLSPNMYEQVTKLLEAELLRSTSEEPVSFADEHKDGLSLSPSAPPTRPETDHSDKDPPDLLLHEEEPGSSNDGLVREPTESKDQLFDDSDSKSSVTRTGRSGIAYDESGNEWDAEELQKKQNNPYRWFIQRQREKQNAKGPSQDEQAASAMEARLRNVSEKFCGWLYDLGGETNADVDPAIVRNLFSTAYDTKPSLSVPIKLVEMTRIPIELRDGVEDTMIAQPERRKGTATDLRSASASTKSRQMSSTVVGQGLRAQKYRYGAWYLPKNLWERSLTDAELRDPKIIKAEREDLTRKREDQINARLAPLHGVDAFKEYLHEKNIRRLPKLITDVERYRRDNPREMSSSTLDIQAKRAVSATP